MIRLENVLKISLQDVLEISWKRREDVFKTSWGRLEDVLKTFLQDGLKTLWRRLEEFLARCLEDVLNTSSKCLEDVFARRPEDILKTSWRRLEDRWPRRIYWYWPRGLEDVLKTSSGDVRLEWIYWSWSRRLLKTNTKDVFKTSSSIRMFSGISFHLKGNWSCLKLCSRFNTKHFFLSLIY